MQIILFDSPTGLQVKKRCFYLQTIIQHHKQAFNITNKHSTSQTSII